MEKKRFEGASEVLSRRGIDMDAVDWPQGFDDWDGTIDGSELEV